MAFFLFKARLQTVTYKILVRLGPVFGSCLKLCWLHLQPFNSFQLKTCWKHNCTKVGNHTGLNRKEKKLAVLLCVHKLLSNIQTKSLKGILQYSYGSMLEKYNFKATKAIAGGKKSVSKLYTCKWMFISSENQRHWPNTDAGHCQWAEHSKSGDG